MIKLTSKLANFIYRTETHEDPDSTLHDTVDFDLVTDEISDSILHTITEHLKGSEKISIYARRELSVVLYLLRNDADLSVWPVWSERPRGMSKKISENDLEFLVPIAKILKNIHDAEDWTELDKELGSLEKWCQEHTVPIDHIEHGINENVFHNIVERTERAMIEREEHLRPPNWYGKN